MYIKKLKVKSRFRKCLYPYDKYHTSGLFVYENRLTLNLLKSKNEYKRILYSKYLWEVHNGRKARKGYEIDHIDGDCTNDFLSNLQEISVILNKVKGTNEIIKKNYKRSNRIFLWCPICGKKFKRLRWKIDFARLNSATKFYFCSRECSHASKENSVFLVKQRWKKIKKKEFIAKHRGEDFNKFSKPMYETKIVRYCDCGKELNSKYKKYCCKKCRTKYGNTEHSFKFDSVKEKILDVCKISMNKFGRYNYSWIGKQLSVSGKSAYRFIKKFGLI
jgi:hypothetical protein